MIKNEILAIKEENKKLERLFYLPSAETVNVKDIIIIKKRIIFEIENPNKDNLTGNYLIISENGKININIWKEFVNNDINLNDKKSKKNKKNKIKPDLIVK